MISSIAKSVQVEMVIGKQSNTGRNNVTTTNNMGPGQTMKVRGARVLCAPLLLYPSHVCWGNGSSHVLNTHQTFSGNYWLPLFQYIGDFIVIRSMDK